MFFAFFFGFPLHVKLFLRASSAHNSVRWVGYVAHDVANFLRDYRTTLLQIARTKSSNDPLPFPREKGSRAIFSVASKFAERGRERKDKGKYILREKKIYARMMTFIILRGRGHRSTMFLLDWEGISLAERCWIRI